MRTVTIADRKLGASHPPFIVAEAGLNHNGDIERALAMVTAAKESGCDAIKFSVFKAAEFCNPAHVISYRFQSALITEPEIEMFRRCELPKSAWRTIRDECDRLGIIFFATPQNESDLNILLDVGVPCVKVGSDDLTNLALLEAFSKPRLPMILSTGMADHSDVDAAVMTLLDAEMVLCACTSEYPCPPEHANLARIKTLMEYRMPVGFSDHTCGPDAGPVAAALGASYFEKHFTLDNELRGPDHAFSANPFDLLLWADAIRRATVLLGASKIEPTATEREQRKNWRRTSGQKIRGQIMENA